jgi:hypothetical protein
MFDTDDSPLVDAVTTAGAAAKAEDGLSWDGFIHGITGESDWHAHSIVDTFGGGV